MLLLPGVAGAGVVWRGDFETGSHSQFSGAQMVSADRLRVVTSPVAEGRYALQATVRQGDDPINSSGNRNELVYLSNEAVGSEYYYRWRVMFAQDFPSVRTWQLFTQWHHDGCCGSPPVEFYVYGEEIRLTLNNSVTPWRTPLVRGVWHEFVFHVKWSPDPAVGFIELWFNGQRVLSKRNIGTMYAGMKNYLKLGLYRNETVAPEGVVYHDGYLQATRLEDVLPVDAPPPPDAGTLDAGTPDAGARDAGVPDAGPLDGGTADAGARDAGVLETGAPDAGTLEPVDGGADSLSGQEEEAPGPSPQALGCSTAGGPLMALALVLLVGAGARRRR
jgi:MYXO-CTERM domain-containing protein